MQGQKELQKKIGERIRKLRLQKGWSQEQFCHETGFARSFASGIELGKKDLCLSTLARLAKAFDMSLSALLKGIDAE